MATPHVAGAVLLLRDAVPDASVEEIKKALYTTAVDLGDTGEDNVFGTGRIDVYDAYTYLLTLNQSCTSDSQCSDGLYCNGAEWCNTSTGTCEFGDLPCAGDEACIESGDSCTDVTIPEDPGFCGIGAAGGAPYAAIFAFLGSVLALVKRRRG